MYFNVHTLTCIHGDVCNSYLILCPFFSPSFLFSFLTLSIPPPALHENNNSFHHHIRGVVLSLFFFQVLSFSQLFIYCTYSWSCFLDTLSIFCDVIPQGRKLILWRQMFSVRNHIYLLW